jgi:hypothetical protein
MALNDSQSTVDPEVLYLFLAAVYPLRYLSRILLLTRCVSCESLVVKDSFFLLFSVVSYEEFSILPFPGEKFSVFSFEKFF